MKEEKDWSKATDEELIAEAYRRYPEGTIFISKTDRGSHRKVIPYNKEKGITWWITKDKGFRSVRSKDGLHCFNGRGCSNPTVFENGVWAKIVSQPKELGKVEYQSPDWSEPKAGDMVEVSDDGINWPKCSYHTHTYRGIKRLYDGHFITENQDGFISTSKFIRLPQKSEVSKMVDSFLNEIYIDDAELNDLVRNAVENAIKWGQNNPNAK